MKVSTGVMIFSWFSIFLLSWLLILRRVPSDWMSWFFFGFFAVVALFASVANDRQVK